MTDLSSPLSVIQAAPSVSLRCPDTQLYEDLDVFVSRKKMSFKYWDPGILIIHQAGEYRSYIKIQRFDDYEKSVSRTVMTPKGLLG